MNRPHHPTNLEMKARAGKVFALLQQSKDLATIAQELSLSPGQVSRSAYTGNLLCWQELHRDEEIALHLWHTPEGMRQNDTVAMNHRVRDLAASFGIQPATLTAAMVKALLSWSRFNYNEWERTQEKAKAWTFPLGQPLAAILRRLGYATKEEVRTALIAGHLRTGYQHWYPAATERDYRGVHLTLIQRKTLLEWAGVDERQCDNYLGLEDDRQRRRDSDIRNAIAMLQIEGYQVSVPATASLLPTVSP